MHSKLGSHYKVRLALTVVVLILVFTVGSMLAAVFGWVFFALMWIVAPAVGGFVFVRLRKQISKSGTVVEAGLTVGVLMFFLSAVILIGWQALLIAGYSIGTASYADDPCHPCGGIFIVIPILAVLVGIYSIGSGAIGALLSYVLRGNHGFESADSPKHSQVHEPDLPNVSAAGRSLPSAEVSSPDSLPDRSISLPPTARKREIRTTVDPWS